MHAFKICDSLKKGVQWIKFVWDERTNFLFFYKYIKMENILENEMKKGGRRMTETQILTWDLKVSLKEESSIIAYG